MAEPRCALPGAAFRGLVRIEEAGLRGMVMLRADPGAAAVRKAVKATVGVEVPALRKAALAGVRGALWMSPDELLLVMPHDEAPAAVARLAAGLAGVHHLAADVSDARAVFRLTGDLDAVREVLAKLTPADLAPGAFGEGDVRRTRLGQVAAAFWIEDGGVTLVCFRSVAGYVFDLLSAAAAPEAAVGYWT
jgi:sarcosine oxidase subunit gamma